MGDGDDAWRSSIYSGARLPHAGSRYRPAGRTKTSGCSAGRPTDPADGDAAAQAADAQFEHFGARSAAAKPMTRRATTQAAASAVSATITS